MTGWHLPRPPKRYEPRIKGLAVLSTLLLASLIAFGIRPALATSKKASSQAHKGRHHHRKAKHSAAKTSSKRSARGHTQYARHHVRNPEKLLMPTSESRPVLDVAQQYLGRPYRFGSTQGSYDCSGFVRQVFAELGVDLPHSAREQFDLGDRISRDDLAPGDLVFFRTYRRGASHVGIYIADDKFIHAATRGGQIQVDSLDQSYYASRYLGARRVEPQS